MHGATRTAAAAAAPPMHHLLLLPLLLVRWVLQVLQLQLRLQLGC
jgi:hypothetical protein